MNAVLNVIGLLVYTLAMSAMALAAVAVSVMITLKLYDVYRHRFSQPMLAQDRWAEASATPLPTINSVIVLPEGTDLNPNDQWQYVERTDDFAEVPVPR